jgi:hypothetical protein
MAKKPKPPVPPVPPTLDAVCGNCKHHVFQVCRRYPPSLINGSSADGAWPKTYDAAWCGEFTPKPVVMLPPEDKLGTWAGSPATSSEGLEE